MTSDQISVVELAAKLAMIIEAKEHTNGNCPDKRTGLEVQTESRMRNKVQGAMRMLKIFKTLREENEIVTKLKGICPGHRLAPGLLMDGKAALQSELSKFKQAKILDARFERKPSKK